MTLEEQKMEYLTDLVSAAPDFGLLYLNKGKWEGKQVVPEDWIRESFKMHVDFGNPDQDVVGYGYFWWIQRPDPQGDGQEYIYAARGAHGQYIFIVPEHDMVVAVNADTKSGQQQRNIVNILYNHILPAVEGDIINTLKRYINIFCEKDLN